jgi:hypothetical protein
MSPGEKKHYEAHEKRTAQGCERLHGLMTRLKIDQQIDMFKRRKITYERAKNMTAREFVALGLSHAAALRLANTLSYASAVEQSYKDAGAASPEADLLQDERPQASPTSLFPMGSYRGGGNRSVPVGGGGGGGGRIQGKPGTRRLSAMGRDLLGVFDQSYETNFTMRKEAAEKFRHPNLKFMK